ncbi:hypothetical protein [Ancylomarina longa]|uniref:Lipoprotein n=1 Tax=Ancylomarina longa TaxID=2487017 RepID=A0A434AF96_9BACT|nr:hypothetical protein [Ancylomarina longa]RUT73018.1 hypothetical protein DLK05_15455 [Ancylomarina longa]
MTIQKKYLFLLLSGILLTILSCSKSDKKSKYIDQNQELLEGLPEVNGYDHTYNYDFGILKEREKVEFYKPVSLNEGLSRIPLEMRNKINLISNSDLSFVPQTVKSNIVTSWNDKNKLVFQIQISYLENDLGYDTNFKDFFIVSITQYPDDPFADEINRTTLEENLPDTYHILTLDDNHPLYYQPSFGSWPRMFDYYYFNEDKNRMYKESTGSHQYYAWYDGLIYKIGCNMDIDSVDPEVLVRKIILGN